MHSEVKRLSEVLDRLGAIWGFFPIIQLCHDIRYGHCLLALMQSMEFRNKESSHPLKPAFLSLVPDGILLSPTPERLLHCAKSIGELATWWHQMLLFWATFIKEVWLFFLLHLSYTGAECAFSKQFWDKRQIGIEHSISTGSWLSEFFGNDSSSLLNKCMDVGYI